jgi:hypothetical protein
MMCQQLQPEAVCRHLPLLLPDPIHPNVVAGAWVVLLPFPLILILFGCGRPTGLQQAGQVSAAPGVRRPAG